MLVIGFCACQTREMGRYRPGYYNADFCQVINNNGTMFLNGQPLSGILYRLGSNKDTLMVASYLNGKENGMKYSYYGNGQMKDRGLFLNGWKQGIFESWYPDGKRRYVYHFKNDEYDGEVSEWYTDGSHLRRQHFTEGHEDGLQQLWYEDGKVRANYVVKGDRVYGLIGTMGCTNLKN